MVHALRKAHFALRRDGVLFDLHPRATNDQIEVWRAGEIKRMGEVDQQSDGIGSAEAALAEVVRERMFVESGRARFELLEHYPSADSWLQRWVGEGWTFEVSDEVLDATNEELTKPGSELVIREKVIATRFDRL